MMAWLPNPSSTTPYPLPKHKLVASRSSYLDLVLDLLKAVALSDEYYLRLLPIYSLKMLSIGDGGCFKDHYYGRKRMAIVASTMEHSN